MLVPCECGKEIPPDGIYSSPEDLCPQTSLQSGHYVVGRVLGKGGFGITYLALDTILNTRVAIKEFFPKGLVGRGKNRLQVEPFPGARDIYQLGVENFLREAQSLAKFRSHPQFVSVLAFFQEWGTGYMVMEYLEGETLEEKRISRGGCISWEEAKIYASELIKGVSILHQNRLIHRDIKPQNIFIRDDGQVQLMDFGAARSLDTQFSKSVWTPGFASPEQYPSTYSLIDEKQGPWTDIYGLGATLYFVLTGQIPLSFEQRMVNDFYSPHDMIPSIPVRVSNAIMKSLEIRVADRFSSIEEMGQHLDIFVDTLAPTTDFRNTAPSPSLKKDAGDVRSFWLLFYNAIQSFFSRFLQWLLRKLSHNAPSPSEKQETQPLIITTDGPSLGTPRQESLAHFKLIGEAGPYQGDTIPIDHQGLVMGRDSEQCSLVFDHSVLGVSRAHLAIRFSHDDRLLEIKDLSSSHGTWLAGKKLRPQEWTKASHGDIIQVGSDRVVFRIASHAETDLPL